jgi:outer membrane protein OmpA-like peptidoglycan-associated protein
VPETTAISISNETFRMLKSEGKAEFAIFIPFNVDKPGIDREKHPNVYDNQMLTTVTRSANAPPLKVVVNNELVELPVMRFEGDFFGDASEFIVLDDPKLPLMLSFRIGMNANQPFTADEIEQRKLLGMPLTRSPDKEALRVVKIIAPCKAEMPAAPPAGISPGGDLSTIAVSATSVALEQAVEAEGRANVEAIFFTVDSANLRPESDVALSAIAEMMQRHPDWRFSVEGHTDSQGGAPYNLELSNRRAAAVRAALTTRFKIEGARLASVGHGLSKPVADNATLEGRARNRRVELVRLP